MINLGYSLYFKIANSTPLEPPNSRDSSKNNQTEITVIKEGEYISSNAFRGNSQVVLVVKNLPANGRDTGDLGSSPRSGRFP